MIMEMLRYLALTACFLLIFFILTALVEPCKERLVQLFKKNTCKTARKFFYLWIGILVLRKLLYYIPFDGIIQTPASVWWMDKEILKPMYTFFIAFMLAAVGMQFAIKYRGKSSKQRDFCFEMAFICWTISAIVFTVMLLTSDTLSRIHIVFSPLLALKMFCSGKYLGLLVSLGLVYLFMFFYRKLIPEIINRCAAKFLVGALLIIIGFGFFFYYQLSGDWEKRFTGKVQAAKSERKIMDLLEAANTMLDENHKDKALKEIATAAAKSGNTEWAMSIAKNIQSAKIKNTAIEEIQEIREKIKEK